MSSEAGRYRKKQVEVEAMKWDGSLPSIQAICKWANHSGEYEDPPVSYLTNDSDPEAPFDVQIWTLNGPVSVEPGEWIVRGVAGEFYPCEPGIFDKTYEPADQPEQHPQGGEAAARELKPTDQPRTKAEALEMALKWGSEWSHWNEHADPENQRQAYVTCAQHDTAEVQRLAALHSMLPEEVPADA